MFSSLSTKSSHVLQSWYLTNQILHLLQSVILLRVQDFAFVFAECNDVSHLLKLGKVPHQQQAKPKFVLCYTFVTTNFLFTQKLPCCFGVGIGKVM